MPACKLGLALLFKILLGSDRVPFPIAPGIAQKSPNQFIKLHPFSHIVSNTEVESEITILRPQTHACIETGHSKRHTTGIYA